jgi:hypothetical protein
VLANRLSGRLYLEPAAGKQALAASTSCQAATSTVSRLGSRGTYSPWDNRSQRLDRTDPRTGWLAEASRTVVTL